MPGIIVISGEAVTYSKIVANVLKVDLRDLHNDK
jgi:hypothetical protein